MKSSLAEIVSGFPLLRRVRAASITDEADLRAYVLSVTALCVSVALSADVANQLTFFVDWPTSFRSWGITTTLVVVLATPISRVIARAQLELYRSKMMFAALNATNEAIVRASSREVMFGAVCGAVVQAGSFTSCMIALVGSDPSALQIQAIAGKAAAVDAPPRMPIGAAYVEGHGLGDIALRTREACVCDDYATDDRCRHVAADALARGVRSAAALPLTRGEEAIGVMMFGCEQRDAFPPTVVPLMRRLADNVAFAMESFDRADMKARAEARIGHLAAHDALTDLPNRAELSRLLRAAITSAAARRAILAVLFIDIDRFKTINDSLGHDAGDTLLVEIAERLRRVIGVGGFVGRIGGDEFVAVLADEPERGRVEARAREILAVIAEPLSLAGMECRVSASIGVAVYPEDGDDETDLVKQADQAMYLAKDGGKNEVRFHIPRAAPRPFETLEMEARLRRALERDEFALHYQPKVDATTRAITGLEALLRWSPPGQAPVTPSQFIPLAEQSGLIVPIGRWALREACAQHAEWRRGGFAPPPIAVNISPRQFLDLGLIADIDAALLDAGSAGSSLQLEITESMVMRNVDHAVAALGEIRRRGIGVAIDDFGTGYSSMSLMKTFPIDTLKIDRSFVQDLPLDTEDRAIVRAIIRMGKALGLRIVAEGVETMGQAEFLRKNRCDELQGFLFGRPVEAELIPALLAPDRRPEPAAGRARMSRRIAELRQTA